MIQFAFNMPLWLMGVYGGAMVLVVLALRLLLGRWLPKRVMPVLWALVLVRLLVPFSVSSPLSLPVPAFLENLWSVEYSEKEQTLVSDYVLFSPASISSMQEVEMGLIPKEEAVSGEASVQLVTENLPMAEEFSIALGLSLIHI